MKNRPEWTGPEALESRQSWTSPVGGSERDAFASWKSGALAPHQTALTWALAPVRHPMQPRPEAHLHFIPNAALEGGPSTMAWTDQLLLSRGDRDSLPRRGQLGPFFSDRNLN